MTNFKLKVRCSCGERIPVLRGEVHGTVAGVGCVPIQVQSELNIVYSSCAIYYDVFSRINKLVYVCVTFIGLKHVKTALRLIKIGRSP